MNRSICILANSIKFGGRCIAGKEVQLTTPPNRYKLTNTWLRPLGHSVGGELSASEYVCGNVVPKLLDIIEIPFHQPSAVVGQPEDWSVEPGKTWIKRGQFGATVLAKLLDFPPNLWLEYASHPDRVSTTWLTSHKSPSLALVAVTDLKIVLQPSTDFNTGKPILKRRCHFEYQGVRYDLALTDPEMQSKYFPTFPACQAGTIAPGPPTQSVACVSLTPALNGMHYKLVAAIL